MNALKTLPAALVAALGVLIAQGADHFPTWVLVVLAALAAAAAVYATPPGPGLRTPSAPGVHRQGGYSALYILWCIVLGLAAVVLLTWLL